MFSRADRDPTTYRLHFEGTALLDEIPEMAPSTKVDCAIEGFEVRIQLTRQASSPMVLDGTHARALAAVDGQRTVRECCERAGVSMGGSDDLAAFAGELFRTLWRVGYVALALPLK